MPALNCIARLRSDVPDVGGNMGMLPLLALRANLQLDRHVHLFQLNCMLPALTRLTPLKCSQTLCLVLDTKMMLDLQAGSRQVLPAYCSAAVASFTASRFGF